jgi:Flp pilus assembly pilin Flp
MCRFAKRLLREDAGTTTIEYALIGTLVGTALIAALQNYSAVTSVLYTVIGGISTSL